MRAEEIAELLLEIGAVALNPDKPFRYTSGILSPIYCDNRLVISYPDKREKVIAAFLEVIDESGLVFDIVGGTSTAGIPHAAWIADRLKLPMVYIRDKAKGHGKKNQIEGVLPASKRVLVVEDLVSTGGSSVEAGLAVRAAGGVVTDCVAIFTYEMQQAADRFAAADIALHSLTRFRVLLDVAVRTGRINETQRESVLAWNADPQGWGKTMGHE
jgi:orotate phosphoribosyltransferase